MEEMRFIIKFNEIAESDFKKLPKEAQIMIQKAISFRLSNHPHIYGKPLRYSLFGYRSLRVSKYRILYSINENIVTITRIDLRKDVYKQ